LTIFKRLIRVAGSPLADDGWHGCTLNAGALAKPVANSGH
jgi:hypothetical protein